MFRSIKSGAMRTEIDKIWKFDELEAEIEGIGRCFAQSNNINDNL